MTRETKIGLLVGLLFIIVIGILLSDHFRGTMEPPQAMLGTVAPNARQAVNVPGSGQVVPPVVTLPGDTAPHGPVKTNGDIDPPVGPVVLIPQPSNPQGGNPQPGSTGQPTTLMGSDLGKIAREHGEDIVPAIPTSGGPVVPTSARSYKAEAHDTVSKMAARFLGANTRLNREAIIRVNPSLQQDPNKVIVGQTYVIPATPSAPAAAAAASAPPLAPLPDNTVAGADLPDMQWMYTVKAGDNLWKIANSQLSDPGEIDAIKELNRDVLKGGDTVRPGMKLRLPAKPLASAN